MRKLTTTVLAGAAAIAVTGLAGGSAQAGTTGAARLVSPGALVWHSTGKDFQDDRTTGCRSHREDAKESPQPIAP
ncbi:hypothetical protein [Actinophytocola sp.]|uniref:hypothetical protein n=1 Tax=Actinophytocola sp. TaxID=1872138 RepID=UPI002D80279C|nr:hypothetical protein [Actinophytocola sp.]HET9140837.1 hypothetical protein [Actinophytocola sp.]